MPSGHPATKVKRESSNLRELSPHEVKVLGSARCSVDVVS